MNTQHTPTPWMTVEHTETVLKLVDADGEFLQFLNKSRYPDDREDEICEQAIAHALRCVNSHDALVAALREIVAMTDEDTGTFRKRGGTYRGLVGIVASAALKAATE